MIKALDIWLPAWLKRNRGLERSGLGTQHVMIAVCDHYEPMHATDMAGAIDRVNLWNEEFPKITREFRDADGEPPKHTFFYPIEQYNERLVSGIAELCRNTSSEMEIHLHHDSDNAENLRQTLEQAKERLSGHGMLSHDKEGNVRYGFIHGNWALDNSHPEGKHCGVQNELQVLRDTGCYADFTLPSAPSRTQTSTINSIYYARSTADPKSHDRGRRIYADRRAEREKGDELLIIQGPLALNWQRRKFGLLPRIENSDLTGANPPTKERLKLWLDCKIRVEGRPNWLFVKLHTHGAIPKNSGALLGEPMRQFHRSLAEVSAADSTLRFHYVTAREMVNIVHAAEAGHSGEPGRFRDYRYHRKDSAIESPTAAGEGSQP